jgi:hypothetical protein
MSKWLIFGTDKTEDGTMEGFQRLNAAGNRDKLFKANSIIFVDDSGLTHADINNPTDARSAGLLVEEKAVDKDNGGLFRAGSPGDAGDGLDDAMAKFEVDVLKRKTLNEILNPGTITSLRNRMRRKRNAPGQPSAGFSFEFLRLPSSLL